MPVNRTPKNVPKLNESEQFLESISGMKFFGLVLILAGHGRQFQNSWKNEKLERRLKRT